MKDPPMPSTSGMHIDPEMQAILEVSRHQTVARPLEGTVTPKEMRIRAATLFAPWNAAPPSLAAIHNIDIPGAVGNLNVRIYDPHGLPDVPLLLYLHGGGWVIGDLELEDRALRLLALESGAKIISLDYRLAPEHPFPAAIEDTVATLRWISRHARELGGCTDRIALGGASAGANIALAATLWLRDRGGPLPAFLLLFYGVYGIDRDTESDRLFGGAEFGGALVHMETFYSLYAGTPEQRRTPLVAPLIADLSGLPPICMNAAGLDPLRDDSRQLYERLRRAGIAVEFAEYPGVVHGFTQYTLKSKIARKALHDAGVALKAAFPS